MQDGLGIVFACLFLILGIALLHNPISTSAGNDTLLLLGGASLLALGLISTWVALKNWWKYRKILKEYKDE
jgi:multisubunit Na+/H+ antiporter MnhB subunit